MVLSEPDVKVFAEVSDIIDIFLTNLALTKMGPRIAIRAICGKKHMKCYIWNLTKTRSPREAGVQNLMLV